MNVFILPTSCTLKSSLLQVKDKEEVAVSTLEPVSHSITVQEDLSQSDGSSGVGLRPFLVKGRPVGVEQVVLRASKVRPKG